MTALRVEERALRRSLGPKQSQYEQEVRSLVRAGVRVLRQKGFDGATVGDILAEAGLSTRAFYRHFRSKSELMLAIYERDSQQTAQEQRKRLATIDSAREQLEGWIDEVLSLAYNPRRARRTRLFMSHVERLREQFSEELNAITASTYAPLEQILRRGLESGEFPEAQPHDDARAVFSVTWSLAAARIAGDGFHDLEAARAYVLRFCLPALGAQA